MQALADLLAALPFVGPLRRSVWAYALVNAAHILGIGLLLGAILPLDLRLMGWHQGPPLSTLAPFLSRIAAAGLALAVATGATLLSVQPMEYLPLPAFRAKMLLIALALVNLLALHRARSWRAVAASATWEYRRRARRVASRRASASVSVAPSNGVWELVWLMRRTRVSISVSRRAVSASSSAGDDG